MDGWLQVVPMSVTTRILSRRKPLCTVSTAAVQRLKELVRHHKENVVPVNEAAESNGYGQWEIASTRHHSTNKCPEPSASFPPAAYPVVKLGVVRKGCNGLSYRISFAEHSECHKLDEVVATEDESVTLVIDKNAVMFLAGVQIDFLETEVSSRFIFRNPNQKTSCGCGSSFSV